MPALYTMQASASTATEGVTPPSSPARAEGRGHWPLSNVEPAVIAAAQPLLLDAAPFERGAAMRAMRIEGADPPVLVAKHDNLLTQKLFLARHLVQLVERADRLP